MKVLVIDDQRSFKKGIRGPEVEVTYARNLDEMIALLPPINDEQWNEIWLDVDMGEKQNVYDILSEILREFPEEWTDFDPLFMIHSSNPVGAQMLVDLLSENYFDWQRVPTASFMEVTVE